VFLWQVFHNKLQTAVALKRRGWHGSPLCCVCNQPENVNHIFFKCVFGQYIWCCIRDAFGLQNYPISIQGLVTQWMTRRLGIPKRLCFAFFAGLAWAIWRNRNKMAIEKLFPLNPDVVIHAAVNFVQIWADLNKEGEAVKMKGMAQRLSNWMHKKDCFNGPYSNIAIM